MVPMAEHKVPQDVEAEDKLLGPLSFRQFIYAMIALGGAAMAYFIISADIIAPIKTLAVAPILVFVVFGVLAIPRKGQPMETYIGALIHFYFQPTRRIWDPDGQENLVEITNPTIDPTLHRTKDISGTEASHRLSFLADIADSGGWSSRGNVNLNDDYALAANMAVDVFDDTSLSEGLSNRLAQTEQTAREEVVAKMNSPVLEPTVPEPAPEPIAPEPMPPIEPVGFAPPAYTPPPTAAPAIVTPPPVAPAATSTTLDEDSLSAMLKQSTADGSMTAFKQTVIQPPGSSPVPGNPTLSTTATVPTPDPVPEPEGSDTIDESAASVKHDDSQEVEVSLR